MEREPQGGSDFGQDLRRDIAEEQPGSLRDAAPDMLGPIDESVAGQRPRRRHRRRTAP